MPLPRQLSMGEGQLVIHRGFRVQVDAERGDMVVESAVERCRQWLEKATGFSIPDQPIGPGAKHGSHALVIVVHASTPLKIGADESYRLTIDPKGVRLEAPTSIGLVRGLATLRQLMQRAGEQVVLPAVTIEDAPMYPWRGLMLDVSRHFLSISALKRNLDAMEIVKLNVLHLHLSDNEGFRIESKVFPRLQQDGSNGEFYTQAEMKDLIRYAGLRGILIVPEFDIPSHAKSWLAGYPELSSSPGPFKPGVLSFDGITKNSSMMEIMAAMQTAKTPALDPTLDSTYAFLDKFIGEMAELFPSPYFHIGADENNGAVWRANPSIAAFMKEHQLADTEALQALFVARVKEIVARHGKQMVAWEEAYAGDQSSDTIFQVWSPMAKTDLMRVPMSHGNKLLMSKGYYLDLFLPAHVHYLNNALPLKPAPGEPLLGGEAAMWTEMADETNLEARIWPRTGAIAERLWGVQSKLDVDAMYPRLFALSAVLDREGVHNMSDYTEQVKRMAGGQPEAPVKTLLDVLVPVKGYKRIMGRMFGQPAGAQVGFDRVADVVLIDSATKYEFRQALSVYLKSHDAAAEKVLRAWLLTWSKNDVLVAPAMAQSKDLNEVASQSRSLAAVANAGLKALNQLDQAKPLSKSQLAEADAVLKGAQASVGETEIAILPEMDALFHGSLPAEPTSYPLF